MVTRREGRERQMDFKDPKATETGIKKSRSKKAGAQKLAET